jgi:hypothetical protein
MIAYMFITPSICSRISLMLNSPFSIAFCMTCLDFSLIPDWALSNNPAKSPMPNILEMKGPGANLSKSERCSPVPMNHIGVLVAATLIHYESQSVIDMRSLANSRGNRSTTFCVTIHLGDNDGTETGRFLERFALTFSRLTYNSNTIALKSTSRSTCFVLTYQSLHPSQVPSSPV